MIFGRRITKGALQISLLAAGVFALASCSSITYGTGTGTTAQTVRDVTRMLTLFNQPQQIVYAPRPGIEVPQTNALPVPTEPNPANQPQGFVPQAVGEPTNCNVGPQLTTPPPGYCSPNGQAAAVGGTAIRVLANPCQWWSMPWAQMNAAEQEAWAGLGWNGTNWASTNTELWPDSAGKLWGNLRIRERRAAEQLGFAQASWDACYTV